MFLNNVREDLKNGWYYIDVTQDGNKNRKKRKEKMKKSMMQEYSIYNERFATAVVRAHFMGRKTFTFKKVKYKTEDHVEGVVEDILRKRYQIDVFKKPMRKK